MLSETRWTWVDAARQGDEAALQAFVLKYRPAVAAYLRARVASADVEDLTQEVFLRVVRDGVLARVDPARGRLRSLLFTVARNALGHHRAREATLKRGGGARHVEYVEDVAAPVDGEEFDRAWLGHLLEQALARLAASHATYFEALRRFWLEGQPQAAIAEALGCSPANVKNYVHRGKQALRTHLCALIRDYASSHQDFDAELEALSRLLPDA